MFDAKASFGQSFRCGDRPAGDVPARSHGTLPGITLSLGGSIDYGGPLSDSHTEKHPLDLDTKVLGQVLYSLNISRHHVVSYPENHPIIEASATKVIGLFAELFKYADELTLGIARDVLLVGDGVLERSNPVYKELAGSLFQHGIASVSFKKGLTLEELLLFLKKLSIRREDLLEQGGLAGALADSGIRGVELKAVDYRAFQSTEMISIAAKGGGEGDSLWESFIGGLLEGSLETAESGPAACSLDPQALADFVSTRRAEADSGKAASYEANIVSFMKKLDSEQVEGSMRKEVLAKLASFIEKLSPEVRKVFLSSAFRSLATRKQWVEDILNQLQNETLLDLLQQIEKDQMVVPQAIMTLLSQAAHHRDQAEAARKVSANRTISEDEIQNRLKVLFREERADEFVPSSYQDTLKSVVKTVPKKAPFGRYLEEFKSSLSSHFVEKQVCAIILELIDTIDPDEQQSLTLSRNLNDLLGYFLETGDFQALRDAHVRLSLFDNETAPFTLPLATEAVAFMKTPEFVQAVLEGLDLWGKEKHDQIRALIRCVGAPFAEPLLELLADEDSLSMRRYYMACLGEMGEAASEAVAARLHDRRWYFVRNLVVLLRETNDRRILTPVGRLVGHSHPKVHLEVMKTYLHFNDPKADRYLLKELAAADLERKLNAVRLCGGSRSAEVLREVVNLLFLKRGGEELFELKKGAIKALAEIGNPAVLTDLEEFLDSKNLRNPILHNRLKSAIVRSLGGYSSPKARALLERLAVGKKGELARLAEGLLARQGGRP